MNEFLTGLPGLFILVLISFVYIGYLHRTNETHVFHTESRSVNRLRTAASVFTVVGAPHFVFITLLAYTFGFWPVAFYFGSLTGFVILSYLAPIIRQHIDTDAHSYADIARQLGPFASFALTALGTIFSIGVIMAQIATGALILTLVAPSLSYGIAVILIGVTVAGYLVWGGYRSLLATDFVQAIVMISLTGILLVYLLVEQSVNPLAYSPPINKLGDIAPLIPMLYIAGVILEIGAPVNWQRILTSKSTDAARDSLKAGGVLIFIWGALVTVIGCSIAAAHPELAPNSAFTAVITQYVPLWVTSLAFVLLIASLVSTADSALFITAIMVRKEWNRFFAGTKELAKVWPTRLVIAGFGLMSIILTAVLSDDMQAVFGVLLNLGFISGPLALTILLSRGGSSATVRIALFAASLFVSLAMFLYVAIKVGDFFSWWSLLIIAAAALPLLVPGPRKLQK